MSYRSFVYVLVIKIINFSFTNTKLLCTLLGRRKIQKVGLISE